MSINVPSANSPVVWPKVFVMYDEGKEQFAVQFLETQCGYFVARGDLVGDLRNFGEVLTQILNGCDQSVLVTLSESAIAEINLIWEANIVLFYATSHPDAAPTIGAVFYFIQQSI